MRRAQKRTAKAVIVFSVLRLIWAGMKANMKLGTLSCRERVSTFVRVYQMRRNLRADVKRP